MDGHAFRPEKRIKGYIDGGVTIYGARRLRWESEFMRGGRSLEELELPPDLEALWQDIEERVLCGFGEKRDEITNMLEIAPEKFAVKLRKQVDDLNMMMGMCCEFRNVLDMEGYEEEKQAALREMVNSFFTLVNSEPDKEAVVGFMRKIDEVFGIKPEMQF